jgi:hypothetical protein
MICKAVDQVLRRDTDDAGIDTSGKRSIPWLDALSG